MAQSLESMLEDASGFTREEFNIDVVSSELKPYSEDDWKEFCRTNGLDTRASGLYIPSAYSAYVNTGSDFLAPNIFHELYGHGLFCEHSLIGRELPEMRKEEQEEFLFDEVPRDQFYGLFSANIGNYEGFAVWLEGLLSEEIGYNKAWDLKRGNMPKEYIRLYENMCDAEDQLSRLGLMAQMGFPKYYDEDDVRSIITKLHRDTGNIHFGMLYGSREPYSDIDLFIVSEKGDSTVYWPWLDMKDMSYKEFRERLRLFDVPTSEALFSGEVIMGDSSIVENAKKQLQDQNITQEAIDYNLRKSMQQKEIADRYEDNTRVKKDALSFVESYERNGELLQKGVRPLTYDNIMNHSSYL